MSEDMIERVARAIDGSAWSENVNLGNVHNIMRRRRDAMTKARAAIEAMREPTPGMEFAGGNAFIHPSLYMEGPPQSAKRSARRIYENMIEAALERSENDQVSTRVNPPSNPLK